MTWVLFINLVAAESMVLNRYFQREASVPHLEGPLSDSVSPASVRNTNDAVPWKSSKSRSGGR